jgi:hypothetical protein
MELPENQIPQFRFLPLGLAGTTGTLQLAEPFYAAEGSYYSTTAGDAAIEVHCLDLKSLVERNQHRHVDMLKLDIEGAEYGVIDQIITCHIPARQILVEFHDGLLPGVRRRQTWRAIAQLLRRGDKLLAEVGTAYTFIEGRSFRRQRG